MLVSFPKKVKRERARNRQGSLSFPAHLRYVFLLRLFLEGRTPALPSPLYRSKLVNTYPSDFWRKGTAFF